MKKIPQMEMSRRGLLSYGAAAVVALSTAVTVKRHAFAHSEHGAAPDLEIVAGEDEEGMPYFQLTVDHGKEVNGALNGPVHIHSGRPHLIRFVNKGELDHEVHFGRNPDLEARLYKENLFGPDNGNEHGAHGFLGVHLESGQSTVLHIWIPKGKEGEWEMGCFIPGHYEMGQRAPIHVISEQNDDHHKSDAEEEGHHDDDSVPEDHHGGETSKSHHD